MKTYQPVPTGAPKRRCPYCRCLFLPPARKRGSPARFCCPEHRKQYHKVGALPFSKLQDQLKLAIDKAMMGFCSRPELEELRVRVRALEVVLGTLGEALRP